jgi:hypothetical protein
MCPACVLIVPSPRVSPAAISGVAEPLADQREHLALPWGEHLEDGSGHCAHGSVSVGRQHAPGHRRVEPGVAGGNSADGALQVLDRHALQHEPCRPRAASAGQDLLVLEGGQHQDRRCLRDLAQPPGGRDPVDVRHPHVP